MAQQSFAGLAPLQGGATAQRSSELGDEAASLLQLVGDRQFPARLSGWKTALQALTERASGSPQAMEGMVSPQLQEMAQRIMQQNAKLSRTFGPYGGNQLPAAIGEGMASLDIPGLYANAAIDAGQKRSEFLRGTSIMAPQGQKTTDVQQRPVDLANIAKQWAGLLQAGGSLYSGISNMGSQPPNQETLAQYRSPVPVSQPNTIGMYDMAGSGMMGNYGTGGGSGFGTVGGYSYYR